MDTLYKNRQYRILNKGWTDVIVEELWKSLKLPCCFAFKNAKVNDNPGEIFVKMWGKCSECDTVINAYALNKPTANGIDIHVSTNDTTGVKHIKKRQLRGIHRKNVVKDVCALSVYAWRREEANKVMSFGNVEPAHLYNENVLRKAKQLEKDRILGLSNVTDPILSIAKLKYNSEFAGFIREIGMDKFYVMYWSNEQIFLYKKFNKKINKTGVLSIDATGSLFKRINRPDGSSNVIFLYQIVAPFDDKILPVCQIISEKHDTNMLSYWLREWLRTPVPCPSEIVVDYSLALLNAVSLAFNDVNLNTYVEQCMTFLENFDDMQKPKCIIRIDIAHIIKQVCHWKCFNDKHMRIKDFYVRCFGLNKMHKCRQVPPDLSGYYNCKRIRYRRRNYG